jgi:hypothetical protein
MENFEFGLEMDRQAKKEAAEALEKKLRRRDPNQVAEMRAAGRFNSPEAALEPEAIAEKDKPLSADTKPKAARKLSANEAAALRMKERE